MNANVSKLLACMLVLVMAAPLAQADQAEPREQTEEELQALYDEAVATAEREMTRASTLSFDEAVDALVRHVRGEVLDDELRFELARYLDDAIDPNADFAMGNEFVEAATQALLEPTPASDNYGSEIFAAHAANMQQAYDAASGVPEVAAEVAEQALRTTGAIVNARSASGGDGWYYYWSETTRDYLVATAKDVHQDVDSIVMQFATTSRVDIYLRYYLICDWWGCYYYYYYQYVYSNPSRLIASDVGFEHAFPADAGQLATRAESSDGLMTVYDSIAHVTRQKAREETTAPVQDPVPLPPLPALPPEVPEGRPGLGDLGAQAPAPNYFGTQSNPDTFQDVPPAPPEAPDVRNRDTTDDARTGVTVGHTADSIYSWESNVVVVRWNNIGTGTEGGTTTLGEQPASFFYDAGFYFTGASGTVHAFDFSVVADLTIA